MRMKKIKNYVPPVAQNKNGIFDNFLQDNEVILGMRIINCSGRAPDPDGLHLIILKTLVPFRSPRNFLSAPNEVKRDYYSDSFFLSTRTDRNSS